MREILFSGKRLDNGEWVEGFYVHLYDSKGHESHRIYTGYAETDCGDFYPDWFEVDPETARRFTELTDKNGTKIYEGDIVDILTENEEIGVVAYEDGGFLVNADGFCVDFHSNINGTDLEVIGNIHDNPELLEEE